SMARVHRAEQEADRDARQANPPAAEQPAPTPRQLALEQAQADALAQATAQVQRWRDAAMARGFVPAMVSKANYMISNPTEHNAEQTQALIDQVRQREPTRAKALQASFYMVNNWLTLDPDKARALIDELQESGYP